MTDSPLTRLTRLRRPALLLRAARTGLSGYHRERELRRLLGRAAPPAPAEALEELLRAEARLEAHRTGETAGRYNPGQHIDLLTALLSEARLAAAFSRG